MGLFSESFNASIGNIFQGLLMDTPITITRYLVATTDDYGQTTATTSTINVLGFFSEDSAANPNSVQGAVQVLSTHQALLPRGTVLDIKDELIVKGRSYKITEVNDNATADFLVVAKCVRAV